MEIPNSYKNYSFDKEKIKNYIDIFSFPRLAGSNGEKRAVELTTQTFINNGFQSNQIIKQPFTFSTFYSTILIKIFIIMNIASLFLIISIKYTFPYFSSITSLFFLIFFFSFSKILRHPEFRSFWEKHLGQFISATNIMVKIPAKTKSEKLAGDIIISAHLDSKSQTYKTLWRVLLFRIWMYFEIIFVILYTIFLLEYHQIYIGFKFLFYLFEIIILISVILIIISNIFLLFLKIGNKSPGSLDNATGMAIVFELSSFFKDKPLSNFNLWFCQFSGEEIGTMGSRFFVDKYIDELREGKTFQFNFDMVSIKGHEKNQLEYIKSYGLFPRKKISPILSTIVNKAAEIEQLQLKNFHVSIGAHTDSIPFHLRKFDVIDLTTKATVKYAHSTEDNPDKVDPKVLIETCRIIRQSILLLDSDFN